MAIGAFLYTEEFQNYDMGPQHPLRPIRLRRTFELLDSYGAFSNVDVVAPNPCAVEDLLTCHSLDYVEAVNRFSSGEHVPFAYRYGLGSSDNPVFPGIWEASTLYTGASVDAAQLVVDGKYPIAGNISGGLHHAHYDRAAGFCVFNDGGVSIHRLLRRFEKVAYVDIDVHHGDGVQEAFYSDPRVLTVSIHQSGRTLFPGTGFPEEIGAGAGQGYSVNIPMWPYTTDEIWIDAFRRVALPILKAFNPDAICLEVGADPHYLDPLAHLALTAQGWLEAVKDVHALGKPMIVLGGGGYNQRTVPRMWTLAFGELFGLTLPDETPESYSYRDQVPFLLDHEMPPVHDFQREQARVYADRVVEEAQRLLLPYHGL